MGAMEKMEAHKKGVLHRAFSVFIFNARGEMLLQQRALEKYHSNGLWTNACCSHPRPGEEIMDAAKRRLKEEMGIDLQTVFSFTFIYKAQLDQNLIEHELDHVFVGTFNGSPIINKKEVEDWKYVDINWLKQDINQHPSAYTVWFKLIVTHPELNSIPA